MQRRPSQTPGFAPVELVTKQRRPEMRETGPDLVAPAATEELDLDQTSVTVTVIVWRSQAVPSLALTSAT